MCLAACIISKGIEDAKRRRSQSQGKPDRRRGLLIRQGEPAFEKAGDIRLFSWLGFQSHEQSNSYHGSLSYLRVKQRELHSSDECQSVLVAEVTIMLQFSPCEFTFLL